MSKIVLYLKFGKNNCQIGITDTVSAILVFILARF